MSEFEEAKANAEKFIKRLKKLKVKINEQSKKQQPNDAFKRLLNTKFNNNDIVVNLTYKD